MQCARQSGCHDRTRNLLTKILLDTSPVAEVRICGMTTNDATTTKITIKSPIAIADVAPIALRAGPAAASCGVSVATLRRATMAGDLASLKVGSARLWLVADLEAWLRSSRIGATR